MRKTNECCAVSRRSCCSPHKCNTLGLGLFNWQWVMWAAIREFKVAIDLEPDLAMLHNNLGGIDIFLYLVYMVTMSLKFLRSLLGLEKR